VPAIVAPRATLPKGYPATPLVAPPDGSRLSTMARASLGQMPRHQALQLTHVEPTRREPVGRGVQLTATDAVLTQRLAQDEGSDGSLRARHRRAEDAYVRTRDSHIRLLPGYERVDLTV
jgi:hypothetical protein